MYGTALQNIWMRKYLRLGMEQAIIFGSAWSKLFRKDIIDRWHLRFKEDVSIREDEIFTFEYCQYIKSVKVINSTSYNYRLTPNSLMRRKYYNPRKMLDVYNYSY